MDPFGGGGGRTSDPFGWHPISGAPVAPALSAKPASVFRSVVESKSRASTPTSIFESTGGYNSPTSNLPLHHRHKQFKPQQKTQSTAKRKQQKISRRSSSKTFSQAVSLRRIGNDLAEIERSRSTGQLGSRDFRTDGFTNPRPVRQRQTPSSVAAFTCMWTMIPLKGFYRGMPLRFQIAIPPMYPHNAPQVKCLTPIFHPNIAADTGIVYLAILATSWRPVLTLYDILIAIQMILLEPTRASAAHCANEEAWRLYQSDSNNVDTLDTSNTGNCASTRPLFHAKVLEHSQHILAERPRFDHVINAGAFADAGIPTKRSRGANCVAASSPALFDFNFENWKPTAATSSTLTHRETVSATNAAPDITKVKRRLPPPSSAEVTNKMMKFEPLPRDTDLFPASATESSAFFEDASCNEYASSPALTVKSESPFDPFNDIQQSLKW